VKGWVNMNELPPLSERGFWYHDVKSCCAPEIVKLDVCNDLPGAAVKMAWAAEISRVVEYPWTMSWMPVLLQSNVTF